MRKSSSGEDEIRFKTSRRKPSESGMWTQSVVEALNVGKYVCLGHGAGGVMRQVDQLTFEAAEEIFSHGVVVGGAPAGHALADAVGIQALAVGSGGVLDAAVAVEDQSIGRLAAAAGHVQSRQRYYLYRK